MLVLSASGAQMRGARTREMNTCINHLNAYAYLIDSVNGCMMTARATEQLSRVNAAHVCLIQFFLSLSLPCLGALGEIDVDLSSLHLEHDHFEQKKFVTHDRAQCSKPSPPLARARIRPMCRETSRQTGLHHHYDYHHVIVVSIKVMSDRALAHERESWTLSRCANADV